MASPLAAKAIALLSPTVGDFVAKAKVSAACKLAKIDLETLERKDLEVFADKLSMTCETLGPAVAAQVKKSALGL